MIGTPGAVPGFCQEQDGGGAGRVVTVQSVKCEAQAF